MQSQPRSKASEENILKLFATQGKQHKKVHSMRQNSDMLLSLPGELKKGEKQS